MHRLAVLFVVLALTATRVQAGPLVVFVVDERDQPDVAARLALERLKAALEASLEAAPSTMLGLARAEAAAGPGAALRTLDDADEAWLRSSFDEAEGLLRDALGWALARLPAVASDAHAGPRLAVAAARLLQLAEMGGRAPGDDALLVRALAWWGELPLPDDEVPPELAAEVHRLARAATACTGEVRWLVLGVPEPGATLALGGRRVALDGEGTARLPCGTWSARGFDADGRPAPWEWRLEVTPDRPQALRLAPRFEGALRLAGERSLEVRAYPELAEDVDALADGRPYRVVRLSVDVAGQVSARDLLEPNVPVAGAPAMTTSAAAPRPTTLPRWVPWALYGVSAAALAAGIALDVVTNRWIRDQNTGTGSRFDRIEAGKVGTWTAFGVAGAAALAGAVWQVASW